MVAKSLDEVTYENVREIGLHSYLEQAVKCRFSYQLAKELDKLGTDSERKKIIEYFEVDIYEDQEGRVHQDCGLVMKWENFSSIYIPNKWFEYMKDKNRPWSVSFIGVLSNDEIMLTPDSEEQVIFNETILKLQSSSQLNFLIFYSEWRKNVIKYSVNRLGNILDSLKLEKPGYKNDEITRYYVSLILPLVERYNSELKS